MIKFPGKSSFDGNDTLNAIKVQYIEDEFGWIVEAK